MKNKQNYQKKKKMSKLYLLCIIFIFIDNSNCKINQIQLVEAPHGLPFRHLSKDERDNCLGLMALNSLNLHKISVDQKARHHINTLIESINKNGVLKALDIKNLKSNLLNKEQVTSDEIHSGSKHVKRTNANLENYLEKALLANKFYSKEIKSTLEMKAERTLHKKRNPNNPKGRGEKKNQHNKNIPNFNDYGTILYIGKREDAADYTV